MRDEAARADGLLPDQHELGEQARQRIPDRDLADALPAVGIPIPVRHGSRVDRGLNRVALA